MYLFKFLYLFINISIDQCVCFIIKIVGAMELVIIVKVVAKITKEVATIAEVADMEVDIVADMKVEKVADMIISLDVG